MMDHCRRRITGGAHMMEDEQIIHSLDEKRDFMYGSLYTKPYKTKGTVVKLVQRTTVFSDRQEDSSTVHQDNSIYATPVVDDKDKIVDKLTITRGNLNAITTSSYRYFILFRSSTRRFTIKINLDRIRFSIGCTK